MFNLNHSNITATNLKAAFIGIATVIVLPGYAIAQDAQSDADAKAAMEARAAELMCEYNQSCGELTAGATMAAPETRGIMTIGTVKSTIPSRTTNSQPAPDARHSGNAYNKSASITSRAEPSPVVTGNTYVPNPVQNVVQNVTPGRAQLMVNFALGSDELTGNSLFEIKSFALALKKLDEMGAYDNIMIEGHADSSGSEAINLPLSERRAASVRKMLIQAGVSADRIQSAGYGSQRPVEGLLASDPLNRRVEVARIN